MRYILILLAFFLAGCAGQHDLLSGDTGKPPVEVRDPDVDITKKEEFRPFEDDWYVYPFRSFGFKESSFHLVHPDAPLTTANKFWLAFAAAGQVGDVVSTGYALSGTKCEEANPLLNWAGEEWVIPLAVVAKTVAFAWGNYNIEQNDEFTPTERQDLRNLWGGLNGAIGFGLTGWNFALDCR